MKGIFFYIIFDIFFSLNITSDYRRCSTWQQHESSFLKVTQSWSEAFWVLIKFCTDFILGIMRVVEWYKWLVSVFFFIGSVEYVCMVCCIVSFPFTNVLWSVVFVTPSALRSLWCRTWNRKRIFELAEWPLPFILKRKVEALPYDLFE